MSKELYSNASSSFLTADITNVATTCTVASGVWPASGNFTINLDGELCLVTAISGSGPYTFTITRGQEGTTGAAHNDGSLVFADLTDGSLRRLCVQSLNGTIQTTRRELNFIGNHFLQDDSGNDRCNVSIGVHLSSVDPSTPFAGQHYFNTTDHTHNVYDGTAWKKSAAYT